MTYNEFKKELEQDPEHARNMAYMTTPETVEMYVRRVALIRGIELED